MAEKKNKQAAGKASSSSTKRTTKRAAAKGGDAATRFTADERAAMRERARELKAEAARAGGASDDEGAVLEKLAAMPAADRALGERLHALVRAAAPQLAPKLWYGMPAYAKAGKVVCFFQNAGKFKARYSTLGFSDQATLDDGDLWPTAFALTSWTTATEARIRELLERAAR
jgi:uncharacterized protein YdhG (YjbR/CyaY superfamily)